MTWSQQTDSNDPNVYSFGYDAMDQLKGANETDGSTGALEHQYSYQYDLAGNRTSEQIDASVNGASYNNLNQLTSSAGGGMMVIQGTLSRTGTVTVGASGTPMRTGTHNSFSASVAVSTGSNVIPIVAKDALGNTLNKTFSVTATGTTAQSYTYDANGNMTGDGVNSYFWDAANRLIEIKYSPNPTAIAATSTSVYDGQNRRVEIIETGSDGTVSSDKRLVWASSSIAEERGVSNAVTKRYFGSGVQLSGTAYFYTRDHLGSVQEMLDVSGTVHARYAYDPWGRQIKSSGDENADFGYTGDYCHAPSGFELTLYRAYNPVIGRWISRDPLAGAEMSQGPNLYEYVRNAPIDRLDPLGLKVYLCCAPIEVNPIANGAAKIVGAKHCWIKTDTVQAGMGPAGGGPLPASPCYGTQTAVTPQDGSRPGTSCQEIPGEDEDCVNKQLQNGQSLGTWSPGNNCNTFANGVLGKCKKCMQHSDYGPITDPQDSGTNY